MNHYDIYHKRKKQKANGYEDYIALYVKKKQKRLTDF